MGGSGPNPCCNMATAWLVASGLYPPEALPVDRLQLVSQCVCVIPDAVSVAVLVPQLLIHALWWWVGGRVGGQAGGRQ